MNPKDLFKVMAKRRTVRKYQDIDIPEEKIMELVIAATMAPSSGNLQNWRFIMISDVNKKRKIAEGCLNQFWMEEAPWHIVVYADNGTMKRYYDKRGTDVYTVQNCAAAIQNLLLMAEAYGLATAWVGAFDDDKVKDASGAKGPIQAVITVGYSNEIVPEPPKLNIYDIAFFDKGGLKKRYPYKLTDWYSVGNKAIIDKTKAGLKKHGKKISEKIKELKEKHILARKSKK